MDNKELEQTKEINELDILNSLNPTDPALNIVEEVEAVQDKIEAISETVDSIDKLSTEIEEDSKKNKEGLLKKLKNKWKKLSKKKKIMIISVFVLFLILIIYLILVFCVFNKKDVKKVKEENVVLEADNYRYENGYLVLLDSKDKELGKYECKNKDEDLCYVAYYDIDESSDSPKKIDQDGNILNVRSDIINDSYVFIYDNDKDNETKINLFDIKNNKILETYNGVKTIFDKYIIVKNYSDSYGILENTDSGINTKIDFNYDNLSYVNEDGKTNIIADSNGRNYVMDINEKIVSKAIAFEIVNYSKKNLVAVDTDNKYYLYDNNGKLVYDDNFDYIKLFDEFIVFVKDKKIFITDADGAKYNENGYEVNNKYKYFQKLFIYDEDNKLDSTYEAFKLTNNANSLTLTIDDKDYVVSKFEGKVSKNTSFVNYFDGILYFYDNEDKTNIIGEYKCSNKNALTESSTNFESCFVANDYDFYSGEYLGLIPIFNKKYVFIKDNPKAVSEDNQNIVLYDLENKKVISKYINVYTRASQENTGVTFVNTTKNDIIAKNKDKKIGVIKIAGKEIKSLIPFNYNNVDLLGPYYLVVDDSGSSFIDQDGKEYSKKVPGVIESYLGQYLRVKENNNYNIYDINGKKINSSSFKDVELFEKYFAGLDSSNKLNIYSYDKPGEALITETISISSGNLRGVQVLFSGDNVTISILNGSTNIYSLSKTDNTNNVVEEEVPNE